MKKIISATILISLILYSFSFAQNSENKLSNEERHIYQLASDILRKRAEIVWINKEYNVKDLNSIIQKEAHTPKSVNIFLFWQNQEGII